MFREKILKIIVKAVPQMEGCELELSENKKFGHFSTNCVMKIAKSLNAVEGTKDLKKSPMEIAAEFGARILEKSPKGIFEKVEAVNPGFINFTLTKEVIQKELKELKKPKTLRPALRQGLRQGELTQGRKTVVIDYSGCNIAKPMGIGHLRSTIIGQTLYNIFKFAGWKVVGDNHLGDWGKQFGILIAAYKADGKPKDISIEYLLDLYVNHSAKIKEDENLNNLARLETKKLHDGDKENLKIWKKFYNASIKEFNQMYKMLGVKFDYQLGESFYNAMLEGVVKEALNKNIAEVSDGAKVIPTGDKTPFIIQKSDGAYLYTTTDLATIQYRVKKFKPDTILYIVANEQAFHFEQLFKAAKLLGLAKEEKLIHVKFGMMLSSDMKKFSTRSGKTIFLLDVLNEAIARARKIVDAKQPNFSQIERQKIARIVGIGALKYNDLSQNRLSDIAFDWDRMLSFDGNSAPYLQYTYARLKSILRKAGRAGKYNAKYLNFEEEIELILKLSDFNNVIISVTRTYFPHYLSDYLYDLARSANTYYQKVPILKADKNERFARLALISSITETLKTGLDLLGIEVIERM